MNFPFPLSFGFLFYLLIAVFFGVLSGVVPGLHINTVSLIMAEVFGLKELIPLTLGIYLPLTVLPLLILASSDEILGSALFVADGLRRNNLVNKALHTSLISVLWGSFFSLLIYLVDKDFIVFLYNSLESYLYYLVLLITFLLIFKSEKKVEFSLVLITSGFIGLFSFLSLESEKFFPMFVGFFSLTNLYFSREGGFRLPNPVKVNPITFLPYSFIGSVLGLFAVLLPGVSSPSVLITVVSLILFINPLAYLSISFSFLVSQSFFSFISYDLLNKARIGALVYSRGGDYFIFFLGLFIGYFLTLFLYDLLKKIPNFNPKTIAFFLLLLVYFFEGLIGLLIAFLSFILGRLRVNLGVSGVSHLGSIIIPVLYFNL